MSTANNLAFIVCAHQSASCRTLQTMSAACGELPEVELRH